MEHKGVERGEQRGTMDRGWGVSLTERSGPRTLSFIISGESSYKPTSVIQHPGSINCDRQCDDYVCPFSRQGFEFRIFFQG